MAYIPPLQAQRQPPSDEEQAQAALAAIEQQLAGLQGEAPEQMGPPGFLERLFTSGAGEPTFQPMGFGQGLLQGLAGGLASRGQKVAQKRQQIESLIEQQRQAKNQQQLEDLKARRAAALAELSSTRGDLRRINRETFEVTPEDVKNGVAPPAMIGQRAPIEWRKPQKPEKPGAEPLVLIDTPEGPRYVNRSDAIGKAPPSAADKLKPPATSEREQITNDTSMMDLLGSIGGKFSPNFVGPAAGRLGGIAQKTGIGRKPGESEFRSLVAGLRNQLLKARSGQNVTETEYARLLEELPTADDPSEVFVDKLNNFRKIYGAIAQTRRDVMSSTGVDLSKLKPLPEVPELALNKPGARRRPPLSTFNATGR